MDTCFILNKHAIIIYFSFEYYYQKFKIRMKWLLENISYTNLIYRFIWTRAIIEKFGVWIRSDFQIILQIVKNL